ncbi:MAG: hypothetical protein WA902_00780 [Thermosynechococcaceae cyanobacterium]
MPWSRNTSWRQGSVLVRRDFQQAGLLEKPDGHLAIAISHDCDIANDNLNAEPAVEFIFARILDEQNGNYAHGKNPRTLHLQYRCEGKAIFFELIVSNKVMVTKINLEAVQPDQTYDLIGSRHVLQSWLAARYRRHALPNSLVDRLRAVFSFIEKEGKKNSSGILSFQLDYEPKDELPREEAYELWISMVYVIDKAEYESKAREIAQRLKAEFPKLLEKTKNYGTIDLRWCEAVSEVEFTLRDLRETVEYHLEHLSYRTEPHGPTV